MTQISITVSETAYWHALIGKAEFHAQHLLPQGVENYLVRLFIRFEQEDKSSLLQKRARQGTNDMGHKLQRLGDQCLLLCGFYPEASAEYGIALDEFTSMGAEAYQKLATMADDENQIIFEYLADRFAQVIEMLAYINDTSAVSINSQRQAEIQGEETLAASFNRIEQLPFSNSISQRVLN